MDVHELSGSQMLDLCGRAVCVELQSKDPPITGNVYTIDPHSYSIGLIQFSAGDNAKKPSNLIIIPGESVRFVRNLNDENTSSEKKYPEAELNTEEARKQFAVLFEAGEDGTSNSAKSEERYARIIEFLQKNQVPYKEDTSCNAQRTIHIGAVRIVAPYTANDLISGNANAVRKMTAQLKNVLES